MLTTTKEF